MSSHNKKLHANKGICHYQSKWLWRSDRFCQRKDLLPRRLLFSCTETKLSRILQLKRKTSTHTLGFCGGFYANTFSSSSSLILSLSHLVRVCEITPAALNDIHVLIFAVENELPRTHFHLQLPFFFFCFESFRPEIPGDDNFPFITIQFRDHPVPIISSSTSYSRLLIIIPIDSHLQGLHH